MTSITALPPGMGFTPFETNGVWGSHFFHLLPFLEEGNLYDRSLGSVPFPTGPITMYYPGNNNVYSQPVPTFLCPSDPSVESGGVVTVDEISLGASCYAANSQALSKNDLNSIPAHGTVRRARPASPPTSPTALRTPFSMPRNMRAAPVRVMAPAAGNGGNAWAYCASKDFALPPPMEPPGKAFQSGFAITGYMGAAECHWPRVDLSGPAHPVSRQLRSDPGLDGSHRRNRGWLGRRQCPHAGPGYERRRLVGRRDARGRRSAGFGLVRIPSSRLGQPGLPLWAICRRRPGKYLPFSVRDPAQNGR